MKQKDILIILVPLFLITILWVIFNIYHNYATSTIEDPLSYQIIPLTGTFNKEAVQMAKNRSRIDPAYEIQAQESSEDVADPISETTPEPDVDTTIDLATDSAEVTPEPEVIP